MTPGRKLALLRKEKGMTQETLSESSRISLRTIQRIENGETKPRAHTLKVLIECLGASADDLVERNRVDTNVLVQRMNASGLAVPFFPLLPLAITWIVWRKYRKESDAVDVLGKQMIGFQLIWFAIAVFVLLATKIIYFYVTGFHVVGRMSPLWPAYLVMVAINFLVVVYSAMDVRRGGTGVYQFVPVFF